jgi:hypothetical protein
VSVLYGQIVLEFGKCNTYLGGRTPVRPSVSNHFCGSSDHQPQLVPPPPFPHFPTRVVRGVAHTRVAQRCVSHTLVAKRTRGSRVVASAEGHLEYPCLIRDTLLCTPCRGEKYLDGDGAARVRLGAPRSGSGGARACRACASRTTRVARILGPTSLPPDPRDLIVSSTGFHGQKTLTSN